MHLHNFMEYVCKIKWQNKFKKPYKKIKYNNQDGNNCVCNIFSWGGVSLIFVQNAERNIYVFVPFNGTGSEQVYLQIIERSNFTLMWARICCTLYLLYCSSQHTKALKCYSIFFFMLSEIRCHRLVFGESYYYNLFLHIFLILQQAII